MINYSQHHDSGSILYSCLDSLVFFLFLSTPTTSRSLQRPVLATCKSFTSTFPQIWFGKEDISLETWQKMRELHVYVVHIQLLQNCEHFESKKENWRHFSLEFLLNLCGFFIPQSNFGSSTPFTIAWAHTTYIFSTVG